ncbi:thioredoxin domain-containing protein [Truepera radiovictrix]|nr:thioredoxin domain-containing protein [Truepera radiovictrix]WMT58271.1 thioredoxin domain-containing protein [Truepera radiovictrix]
MNRLSRETSPYLLQHAENPVDWFPWGEEAFAKARAEDKPILLSVGYAACHWCHVMAHESFENPEIADLMNAHFVNVKVDREERPDVDAVYMSAVQAMTGSGGWPMTVALTPDGKPFFGGTYYPPEDRLGHPGFKRVLLSLAEAWRSRRDEVLRAAETLTNHLADLNKLPAAGEPSPGALGEEVLAEAVRALQRTFDPQHGGFGGAPKFPPHGALAFLLRRPEPEAREMAYVTLDKMAAGGIFDQLGGGFARYSVDARWLVPHFEKMLYDNAQLVGVYAEAYAQTRRARYREVVEATLAFVQRELTSPEGCFYSALDADSEGEEGKFYVWRADEFDVLGEDAALAKVYFGVSAAGNFEGRNVLFVPHPPAAVAERFGLSEAALAARLARVKRALFEIRSRRTRPGLDDKVLASWNGLMIGAFARAGRVLAEDAYLEAARRAARGVRSALLREGRLWHTFRGGEAKVEGLLEDYALLGLGLLELYRATLEGPWLLWALELAEVIAARFTDPEGGFFSTAADAEALVVRPKELFDAALPASSAAAALLLASLARYTDRRAWETLAARALTPLREALVRHPNGFGTSLQVLAQLLAPPQEVALVGPLEHPEMRAMEALLSTLPPEVAVARVAAEGDPLAAHLPFVRGRRALQGEPTAYVCQRGACQLPVTSAAALAAQLGVA